MPSAPDINSIKASIGKLTGILYPKARAFRLPMGSYFRRLHTALSISEAASYRNALLTLDSIIADNENFTADDATDWERRLGIASGGAAVPLADRIKAINRKINHPGTQRSRQNFRYIESQLQAAGFSVVVFENRFDDGMGGYVTKTPEQILGVTAGAAFHSPSVGHGTIRHGAIYNNVIANHLEQDKDATFSIGSNYQNTFYVTGGDIDEFASIPEARKTEFRQLLLLLKPVQTIGFLFVNYV